MSSSEDVTKTWVRKKGVLVMNRPKPSKFSLGVCLTVIFSLGFGFVGGFVTANFSLDENYSTVYESLLGELRDARACLEREKNELQLLQEVHQAKLRRENLTFKQHNLERDNGILGSQAHDQAIFSVFENAIDLFEKNNKVGGCREIKNIIELHKYDGEWRSKAKFLLGKNCKAIL